MLSFKLMVLLLSVSVAGLYKTTHAELVGVESNNATVSANKEKKTVIELKDITVNTGLNLHKTLAQLNGTEASNIPRVRKVTSVDNDSLSRKQKAEVTAKEGKIVSSTAVVEPLKAIEVISEAGVVDIKVPSKEFADNTKKMVKILENITSTHNNINSNKTVSNLLNSTDGNEGLTKQNSKSNATTTLRTNESSSSAITNTTTKPTLSVTTNITAMNITNAVHGKSSTSSPTATTTTTFKPTAAPTTTTTTTTSTTTTTTPKPKKPTITYSLQDLPDLEKHNPELTSLLQSSATYKLPIPDGPHAQPSQEFNSNFHRGRDIILPIVSMIFIIPLVIGILITSYRRFRDCWSTRHYRRMDFLVDGMYND